MREWIATHPAFFTGSVVVFGMLPFTSISAGEHLGVSMLMGVVSAFIDGRSVFD